MAFRLARRFLALVALACWPEFCHGQNVVLEGFDSPEATWRDAGGDVAQYRIDVHKRTAEGARSGAGCEYLQLSAGDGTSVRIALAIGQGRVIPELKVGLWMRADRPGLQLLGRVVLPRTIDPRTKKPVTRYIAGTSYSDVDRWEELRLDDLPRLVQQQVRVLRSDLGQDVDSREAYLDRLALNIYGGRGKTQVWIDDLQITGFFPPAGRAGDALANAEAPLSFGGVEEVRRNRPKVELTSSILLVDGRPMFPRLIEYQGESFGFLKEVGFNGILLSETPTALILEEAARVGFWVVCPPPRPSGLNEPNGPQGSLAPFDARYDRVLAWHLGQGLTKRELETTERWAAEVLRADGDASRPLVCDAESELKPYSRIPSMIMLTHRFPAGTSFELADYGAWLHDRPRLALPGTAFWTTIQTQFAPQLAQQVALLSERRARAPSLQSEQIQLLVQSAVAAGARGLVFASRSALDATDGETQQRARTLELINRELALIDRWVAVGELRAKLSGIDASDANPGVSAAVLQTDQTRVLLPVWLGTDGQYVPGQSAGNNITFIVPGAPESHKALEITPGGLRPIVKLARKPGGMHVQLEEFSLTAMVVMTDEVAIGRLTRAALIQGPKTAKLVLDLAVYKYNLTVGVDAQLTRLGRKSEDAALWLGEARRNLAEADRGLANRDYRSATVHAQRAMRPLRMLEHDHWKRAVAAVGRPAACPLAASFATLPQYWILLADLDSAERSRNLLPESDMEDVDRMYWAGWRLNAHSLRTEESLASGAASVRAWGELVGRTKRGGDPYAGDYSFHLKAIATDPENPPELIETPPLWLTSPALPLQAGQWVRIHGWVYVPKPITASLDGLLIFDSLGGEPLAERFGVTDGWKEFTLYRAVPATGPMTLTIALTGLGEAWVDNVSVEVLQRRRAAPLAPRPSAGRPLGNGRQIPASSGRR
ncbi:MAG TPA: hypothetical protein VMV10_00385 [Pirellulales bacterium]|nr:hypothetical protein [Pirellulales bacterium]